MQLIPCQRPPGSLESAPRTSLRADSADERWDGFWCDADGKYFARCTHVRGDVHWFRIVDEGTTHITALRWTRLGARSILVGTSRRRRARSLR